MADDDSAVRFPRSVYGVGSDPDPRFSLANERTFLSWIRTSLAMVAAGVALGVLPADMREPFGTPTAVALVFLGMATSVRAWLGWCRTERALRLGNPLPGQAFSLVVAAVALLAAAAMAVDVLS